MVSLNILCFSETLSLLMAITKTTTIDLKWMEIALPLRVCLRRWQPLEKTLLTIAEEQILSDGELTDGLLLSTFLCSVGSKWSAMMEYLRPGSLNFFNDMSATIVLLKFYFTTSEMFTAFEITVLLYRYQSFERAEPWFGKEFV